MCEICNMEKGTTDLIGTDFEEVKIGRKVIGEHQLSMFFCCNDDGTYEIRSEYFIDDNTSIANMGMEIRYCPYCGRELPYDEIPIPWVK